MKFPFTLLLSIFCFTLCYPQKAPIKFGEITKDLLEMKVYDKDTSASAVIICDYGHFISNQSKFSRILRIKILKKDGYFLADRIFPTSSKADIRGITYNLENGEIIEEKLQKESIYAELITDDRFNMRVSMPNVKVGSVLDIEFVYFGFPREWYFQDVIPVIWSELDIGFVSTNYFRKNFFGYEPLEIIEDNRWVAKNMPAFKEEPYLNSNKNYITRYEFELSQITETWDDVAHLLQNYKFFGGAITWPYYLKETTKSILERNLSDEDKIEAAFNAVKSIKWNTSQSCFVNHEDLGYVYKNKIGNSAEINLVLLQLLKNLDFDPYPVILSTRKNGILSPASPSIFKLNHIIVSLFVADKSYLLDATEEYMPFDLLPEKCLNWQGVLLNKERGSWIDLNTLKKDKEFIIYSLSMNEDLVLTGNINHIRFDYAAYNFRKNYFSFNGKTEFINDYAKNRAGLKIVEEDINNLDSFSIPVEDNYKVVITDQLTKIGDEYFLYPLLYEQIKDNPFRIEERNYPIDFAYKREKTVTVNIQLPEEFEILEIPKSVKMKLSDNAGYFLYTVSILNNLISVNFKYSIDKEIFLPDQYPEIKEFYSQMIIKNSQPIILKKKI